MIYVEKLNGKKEPYNEEKLRRSLTNAGASEQTINIILKEVKKILYDGIKTKEIYKFALSGYKENEPLVSSRYTLKNSIMRLGKTGFPFESFVARILEKQGYNTKLNQKVRGKNVMHEIDVSAQKGSERIMIECKHHAKSWTQCRIQTALYVYARFLDTGNLFNRAMLVTNTKFSSQAIHYSKGVDLRLMGWKYPKGDSLEHNIERFKLYPITMLHSIKYHILGACLKERILTLDDLKNVKDLAKTLHITQARAKKISDEVNALS